MTITSRSIARRMMKEGKSYQPKSPAEQYRQDVINRMTRQQRKAFRAAGRPKDIHGVKAIAYPEAA